MKCRRDIKKIPKTFKSHKVVRTSLIANPAHHRPSGILEIDRRLVKAIKQHGITDCYLNTILQHELDEWKFIKHGMSAEQAHKEAVKKEPKDHRKKINEWLKKNWFKK